VIKMKKVLVPTDFPDSPRHATSYGVSFAKEYGAELVLLHVVENITVGYASDLFPVPMAEVFQEISGYAKTELAKLAAEAREKGVGVTELVVQGKPSAEIIRHAAENAVDMIVLGTHGKGMLDQALFGSTTERGVRRAPCPVRTVRMAEHEFVEGDGWHPSAPQTRRAREGPRRPRGSPFSEGRPQSPLSPSSPRTSGAAPRRR